MFWEPVYYFAVEPKLDDTPELMGRFVGISVNVGHPMTDKILTQKEKIIHRAEVRTALTEGAFDNVRAKQQGPAIAPGPDRIEINEKRELPMETDSDQVTPGVETVEDEDAQQSGSQEQHVPIDMFANVTQRDGPPV